MKIKNISSLKRTILFTFKQCLKSDENVCHDDDEKNDVVDEEEDDVVDEEREDARKHVC